MKFFHRRQIAAALAAALAAGTGPGCSTGTGEHLIFTTYTKVGVDISAVNQTPTEAVFGYKRFEGAIVPVDPGDTTKPEAHSVFAGLCARNNWLTGLKIAQVFATGAAAVDIASSEAEAKGIAAILKCSADSSTEAEEPPQ